MKYRNQFTTGMRVTGVNVVWNVEWENKIIERNLLYETLS